MPVVPAQASTQPDTGSAHFATAWIHWKQLVDTAGAGPSDQDETKGQQTHPACVLFLLWLSPCDGQWPATKPAEMHGMKLRYEAQVRSSGHNCCNIVTHSGAGNAIPAGDTKSERHAIYTDPMLAEWMQPVEVVTPPQQIYC